MGCFFTIFLFIAIMAATGGNLILSILLTVIIGCIIGGMAAK